MAEQYEKIVNRDTQLVWNRDKKEKDNKQWPDVGVKSENGNQASPNEMHHLGKYILV